MKASEVGRKEGREEEKKERSEEVK